MCRQTEEEVEPTVGLPRYRHFVGFLNTRKTLRINRRQPHNLATSHDCTLGDLKNWGVGLSPSRPLPPQQPPCLPLPSRSGVCFARAKVSFFSSSLFFPSFSLLPPSVPSSPSSLPLFCLLLPAPPRPAPHLPLPSLIPLLLTLTAHSELTLTK